MKNGFIYLIRYAELGIKSRKTRSRFEKILIDNIKRTLFSLDPNISIIREFGRIFLLTDSEIIDDPLKNIFGISSFSRILKKPSIRSSLINEIVNYSKKILKPNETFAVRCRRIGQQDYTSKEIEIEAGSKINIEFNGKLKVNLSNPDKLIFVEIRGADAYLYDEIIEGLGGLPLGTQGKFVSLISGGIDSPVATYLMMKRGAMPILLYFDNSPYTDQKTNDRVIKVAKEIQKYASGKKIKLFIAKYGGLLNYFMENISNLKYLCVLCKRNMFKIAEKLAIMNKAEAIVTGESLGQKASQTLRNSLVISKALSNIPIHRPLISFDKIEIESLGKKIGTFDISIEKAGCCDAVPKYPSTNADLKKIEETESDLNLGQKIQEIIRNLKLVEIL